MKKQIFLDIVLAEYMNILVLFRKLTVKCMLRRLLANFFDLNYGVHVDTLLALIACTLEFFIRILDF